jgi:hypothetical protein
MPANIENVLTRIADRLRVPDHKRPAFRRCLLSAIGAANRSYGSPPSQPRRSPTIKFLERLRRARAAEISSLLRATGLEAHMAVDLLMCATGTGDDNLEAWLLSAGTEQRSTAIGEAKAWAMRDLPEGGRTRGTPGNSAFDLFVSELYYFASAFGGELKRGSRKGTDPVKGPVREVLESLRPTLPPRFIPAEEGSILKAINRAADNWGKESYIAP